MTFLVYWLCYLCICDCSCSCLNHVVRWSICFFFGGICLQWNGLLLLSVVSHWVSCSFVSSLSVLVSSTSHAHESGLWYAFSFIYHWLLLHWFRDWKKLTRRYFHVGNWFGGFPPLFEWAAASVPPRFVSGGWFSLLFLRVFEFRLSFGESASLVCSFAGSCLCGVCECFGLARSA